MNWTQQDLDRINNSKENYKKKTRLENSIGKSFFHDGVPNDYGINKYQIDNTRRYYVFDIIPIGKPRMTQSDKWKTNPDHPDPNKRKREVIVRYHAWQDILRYQAEQVGFELKIPYEAVYFMPMPKSWSKKKKEKHIGMPHKNKSDIDNISKGIFDTLHSKDQEIWSEDVKKIWAYNGSIVVFQ